VGGLELVEDLEDHQGKAVDGGDDLACFGDGERGGLPGLRGAEGVKGPVHDSVAVKEDQKGAAHGVIITGKGGEGIRGEEKSLLVYNEGFQEVYVIFRGLSSYFI